MIRFKTEGGNEYYFNEDDGNIYSIITGCIVGHGYRSTFKKSIREGTWTIIEPADDYEFLKKKG